MLPNFSNYIKTNALLNLRYEIHTYNNEVSQTIYNSQMLQKVFLKILLFTVKQAPTMLNFSILLNSLYIY